MSAIAPRKRDIVDEYIRTLDINLGTTCAEFCAYRDKFSDFVRKEYGSANGFVMLTEYLLVEWFKLYFAEDSSIQVLRETKYPALIGNQNLDIPILKDGRLYWGISVKARTDTSGYLDGADFTNPLIGEYADTLKKQKSGRISVSTFLQDIARIENIQLALEQRFKSFTVVYDKLNDKNRSWVSTFETTIGHSYIFLKDEGNKAFKAVLEEKVQKQELIHD